MICSIASIKASFSPFASIVHVIHYWFLLIKNEIALENWFYSIARHSMEMSNLRPCMDQGLE